ncbi:hypothetical protein H8E88_23475 [candidate division KSB1 bacterium]|nr:hypothetical protein [candidate division KSB1 bacterium]MBL7094468.1 hypothetical protein [candidate division KSB1 bacterium]
MKVKQAIILNYYRCIIIFHFDSAMSGKVMKKGTWSEASNIFGVKHLPGGIVSPAFTMPINI